MDIKVTFQDGRWVTDPGEAIVTVGTIVRWVVRAPILARQKLRWTIDFKERSPFGNERRKLKVVTENTGGRFSLGHTSPEFRKRLEEAGALEEIELDHRGTTKPLPAEEPGSYKYDLHLEDGTTGENLGDEDPIIHVVRPRLVFF